MKKKKLNILGLGFGNTIADLSNFQEKQKVEGLDFEELKTVRPCEDSLSVLRRLKEKFDKIFIFTVCSLEGEVNTKLWLFLNDVVGKDKIISKSNLKFCRYRWDKTCFCQDLEITHFVDDRLGVLTTMGTVPYKFQFGDSKSENKNIESQRDKVTSVLTWKELEKQLTASLI